MIGTQHWNDLSISDGRFSGRNADNYNAEWQFGGSGQSGVAGLAWGAVFRSAFYGE